MANKIVTLKDGNEDIIPLGKSNPNLLLNPWFTINQQGKTSWTESDTICVDGWKNANWGTSQNSTTYANNQLTFNFGNVGGGGVGVNQFNEEPISGKLCTYTLKLSDGRTFTASGIPSNSTLNTWTGINFWINNIVSGIKCFVGISFVSSTKWFLRTHIESSTTSGSITVDCIKLEYGSESTLHLDSPPDEKDELWKVQRYYHLYGTSGQRPTYAKDCRPEMRANPSQGTIVINGTTYYYNDANL